MYPEHDKLKSVQDRLAHVTEFLEWLLDTKRVDVRNRKGEVVGETGVWLAAYDIENRDDMNTIGTGDNFRAALLGEFFGIDPHKLEEEKRAMLDSLAEVR